VATRVIDRGELVHVRHPGPGDREEFLARAAASEGLHRPWVYPPRDDAAFAEYLRRLRRADDAGFLVCRNEDRAIAGVVNLNQIFLGNFRNAYLGYYAFAPFAGRGLMTEGIRLVMRHAFGPLGLHRVEANIQPANTGSIALARRLGFRREGLSPRYLKIGGRWRDHERWAALSDDPVIVERPRRTRSLPGPASRSA
jgi:ribosomal-protein-alanine N-acetyltransferase